MGGNSQTLFMACISPSDTNASETLSTLQYANRARNIKNAPTRNVDATALELQRLRTLTHLLKCELIKQRFDDGSGDAAVADPELERGEGSVHYQDIGVVDEKLLLREDVVAYMNKIDEKLCELSGSSASNLSMTFPTNSRPSTTAASRPPALPSTPSSDDISGMRSVRVSHTQVPPGSKSIPIPMKNEGGTEALILDFNPEEDMQIIDQLLELQQHEQKFQEGQKNDQGRLDDMEGEIEAQEGRLLQLRDHLKVYHNMKDKYEQLMREVQSLEAEKLALAGQLEKAQADPTKGCSEAIKAKLQKVEEGLASARSETRKTQQMYRLAEQEAQKCKVLERKIQDLKQAKVNLMKKQREDAAKHKEFTNQKTAEIHALKRREKNADKKISKMETECQKYKANLERSRSQCDKLSDKLKQTESHLMRLLTKKRNTMYRHTIGSRQSMLAERPPTFEKIEQFAPLNEEVQSIKFLLDKTASDCVTLSQNKDAYESKVIEHGKLMQAMAKEAKQLHELRQEYKSADHESVEGLATEISEREDTVQDLQLQIEFLENDMENLREKFPQIESQLFEDDTMDENGPTLKMIAKLNGPVLRTLLWKLMESYIAAELQCRNAKAMLDKKESTLKSFENEVLTQHKKIDALVTSLDRRRTLDGQKLDPADVIRDLEQKLDTCIMDRKTLSAELETTRDALTLSQVQHAQAEERLALLHSQQKLTESSEETQQILRQLHDVLAFIGVPMEDRDTVRQRLENCVDDACSNMISEATKLRDDKLQQVNSKRDRLAEMYALLGVEQPHVDNDLRQFPKSLNEQLDSLDQQLSRIQPQYQGAVDRHNQLASDAENLTMDLQLGSSDISSNLQKLLRNRRPGPAKKKKRTSVLSTHHRISMEASREARAKLLKNVAHMMKGLQTIEESSTEIDDHEPPHREMSPQRSGVDGSFPLEPDSLASSFLDVCEKDIKRLRLLKSERLLANAETCENINSAAREMHVRSDELSAIILHSLKKRNRGMPHWWKDDIAMEVFAALSKKASILVHTSFTNHLNTIFDVIQVICHGRKLLSDTLAKVINDSHVAFLSTAQGCGMDVGDLAQSLHEALFNLPPLSKEHVKACIDEMQMLVTAAESVAQSEIETLTVLWEGLNLSSSERGRFWAELDHMTSMIEVSTESPFDSILEECQDEVEEWVLQFSKEATRVQRILGVRVFKLSRVHQEVEKLKRTQDAKNGIMSLNAELNLLSAKLADFEENACKKERLLNKKANSSSLLGEERFRKQMQSMFVTKLDALRQMLNDWESNEGKIEDEDMLSEVVRGMLQNSHRIEAWMNEKTSLMHLRTTRQSSALNPSRATTSNRPMPSSGSARVGAISSRPDIAPKGSKQMTMRASSASTLNGRQMNQREARPARSTSAGHHSRSNKASIPPRLADLNGDSAENQKRKALSSSSINAAQQEETTKRASSRINETESPAMLPFGNILAEIPSEKENDTCFHNN